MRILQQLDNASSSTELLSLFLKESIDSIHSTLINIAYQDLNDSSYDIDSYITSKYRIIKKLDFSKKENQLFLDILLNVTERLGFSMYFQRFYKLKLKSNLFISSRNKATSSYLIGIRQIDDFENIIDGFFGLLQKSFEEEDDSDKWVIGVFVNYYVRVIRDFVEYNSVGVAKIRTRLKSARTRFSFLNNSIVDDVFNVSIGLTSVENILQLLDSFLNRTNILPQFSNSNFLLEEGTEYSSLLEEKDSKIAEIRKLSSRLYDNLDTTFHSLGRGVSILSDEQQLFAYLHSYGKMHFSKCNYAFNKISNEVIVNSDHVIDWGCGQALATISLFDYMQGNLLSHNLSNVILIEPSQIALKRASLHVEKFDSSVSITTINKDLDSLNINDFTIKSSSYLHLFSNILDIDDYSTKQLSSLIKSSFKGLNYFIVTSPYITELKTNRIDIFLNEFEDCYSFDLLLSENKDKGEWVNNWTMVVRIIKVVI